MVTVQGVVDRVGPTLLRAVVLTELARSVADVVIAEPGKRTHPSAGDLVLGVAVASTPAAVALVRHCGERAAAAVLLKPPFASGDDVLDAARAAGLAVVEVRVGAAWAQLVWLLRAVLDAAAADESDTPDTDLDRDAGGLGDLFRLADAVAAVVDAPVTIEDANSRVVAYSARQDRTDPARVSTIMGRRVPDDVLARFRSRGVFRALSRGRSTIFVPAQPDGTLPRLIVPIRMGGELLGSMWAVVPGPVPDERAAAFADTGPVVALHLLRWRAMADAQRRRSADLVRAALEGSGGARAATELGLDVGAHRVVAISADTEDGPGAEGVRLALWERISRGIGRRPAVADLHGVLYAIVPEQEGEGWPALKAVLAGAELVGQRPMVAAGAPAPSHELTRSRAQADETLALLRAGLVSPALASYEDVWAVLALHRAAEAASRAGVTELGPIPMLRALDEQRGTDYLATLYQWLQYPGDPRAASRALRIHPNTFRYRMRRLRELADIELENPQLRLALLIQLVALHWSAPGKPSFAGPSSPSHDRT